ncbi:MAG: LCP family protein [Candidatus Levyibacteriota bacterium]
MDNVYHPKSRLRPVRRRKPVRKRVFIALILACLLIGGVLLWRDNGILDILWSTIMQKDINLQEAPGKTVNLLLLGVGGGTHDGPDLTDTIIFASINPTTKKVTLVSLPRDLWVPQLRAKVNSAYTYAKENQAGNELSYTKKLIGGIVGQPVNYAVKIDFSGFVKAVDIAGGLDINVDRTFDDYQYPISGKENSTCGLTETQIASASAEIASGSASESGSFACRYEHLHFTKGKQHLDGETALKYVRSRHAMGPEGSDFSRSKRQEKVITAFKDKMFSVDTFLNPVKLVNLVTTLKESINTDIKQSEYPDFIHLAQKMKGAKITSAIMDTGDNTTGRLGLLVNPPIIQEYSNQWVLSPRAGNGDYTEIQTYVACIIDGGNCMVGKYGIVTPTPKPTAIPSSNR